VTVRDTQTNPEKTLEALKELQAEGVRIFVGPEDSQSLSYVREYANESGLILISCASTAPSLAIANDTTFRLVSDDASLARLLTAVMQRDGIRVLIPLARDGVWADGMLNATRKEFEEKGGVMREAVRYDPGSTNFSRKLDLLRSEVRHLARDNATVFAAGDPVLSQVRWYGNDLTASALIRDKKASEFATSTRFLFPMYGAGGSPKFEQIKRAVWNETGEEASSLAINDYDALWLITNTLSCWRAPMIRLHSNGSFRWLPGPTEENLAG